MSEIEHGKQFSTRIKSYKSTITNHSSPISTVMQSLKKICQEMLKIERRNKVVTDGWTDRQTDTQSKFLKGLYNIIPRTFKWRGIIIEEMLKIESGNKVVTD